VLEGEKVLVTGITGKIAFPIARRLAERNEVWGVARLRGEGDAERVAGAGIRPVALDVAAGDFSSLPEDFTYVFHAAVDPGRDWDASVRTNAHNSGELL
jgi:nucleoside-diphosphate-sugar epimerase